MTFQLVYYSQQDQKWKQDILGFSDPGDTIGYVGYCADKRGHADQWTWFHRNSQDLNQKLKECKRFYGSAIRWDTVSQIYPQINVKSSISCGSTDAPLGLIDASIAAGQPVIVMVDSTPAAGLLTHWVVLYAKDGSDYLMLDPWPYQTDVTKKTYLMPRYSQGNPLRRSIMPPSSTIFQRQRRLIKRIRPNRQLILWQSQLALSAGSKQMSRGLTSARALIFQPEQYCHLCTAELCSLLGSDDYAKIGGGISARSR
jgi:hypothetical protein